MEAVIHIAGVIGDIGYQIQYTFASLASDIKEAREKGATSFKFVIDSDGGLVDEGFLMASYIQSLKEPTVAVAVRVYSIANIIYFACDKRESDKHGMFMLHQAWMGIEGNSKDLREYATALEKEDDRIATYIASRTGLDYEAVKGLMGTDRFIEREEAERLGFLTSQVSLKIAALYTKKESNMSKVTEALDTIKAYFQGAKNMDEEPETDEAVNMDLELEDGNTIFIESEDGEFEGKATNAPDGTHRLSDGRSITVADGIVTSVQEGEGEEANMDEEMVSVSKAEYEEMQKALADAQASAQATETEYQALSKEVMDIKAMISSSAKPLAKHPRFNQQSQNPTPEKKAEEKKLHGADALRKKVLKRG